MDATDKLLELELAREARRKSRNRWLLILLVIAILFAAFAAWGVSSQRASQERSERIGEISRIYGG